MRTSVIRSGVAFALAVAATAGCEPHQAAQGDPPAVTSVPRVDPSTVATGASVSSESETTADVGFSVVDVDVTEPFPAAAIERLSSLLGP